ncbi:protein sidekick-2-like [Tubulanus polymorphus]
MSQERMVSNNSTKFRIFPTYQLLNSSQLRCNDTEGVAYELYYQLADSADSEWKAFRASYPPDMVPYTKYRMKVGAKNKGNAEYVSGESIEVVPGNGVTDLTAMNTSFGRVNVTWKIPNTLKHLKFEFHGRYRLRGRRNSPAIWAYQWQISPFPTNNTDMEFVELSPYSTYDVGILAVQLGEGAILRRQYVTTSILTMQSEPVGSPEPPVVIPEKVALKDFQETTYAGVTFSHIPRKNQNGIFGGFYYTLYEKSTGEVVRENITMHTSISLKGLKPYTTYVVSYAWTNEAGKSEQSNNTEFTTDEAALLKINITLKQVSLKTRSGSHLLVEYDQQEGGGKVLKYAAQCGETTGENVQPLRSSKSSWNMKSFDADENIVYDLKPSTWYGCQGAALSKKGWSRPSPYVYVYIN